MVQTVTYTFRFGCSASRLFRIVFEGSGFAIAFHTKRGDLGITVSDWHACDYNNVDNNTINAGVQYEKQRETKFQPAKALPAALSKVTGIQSPHCFVVERKQQSGDADNADDNDCAVIRIDTELGFEESVMQGFKNTTQWTLRTLSPSLCEATAVGTAKYTGRIPFISGTVESSMIDSMKRSFELWGRLAEEFVKEALAMESAADAEQQSALPHAVAPTPLAVTTGPTHHVPPTILPLTASALVLREAEYTSVPPAGTSTRPLSFVPSTTSVRDVDTESDVFFDAQSAGGDPFGEMRADVAALRREIGALSISLQANASKSATALASSSLHDQVAALVERSMLMDAQLARLTRAQQAMSRKLNVLVVLVAAMIGPLGVLAWAWRKSVR